MSTLLKKPTSKIENNLGKYQAFNLRENPFPSTPAVNKNIADIRYNGQIYEARIRETEYSKIENNFLKVPQSNPNHIRLGFILDDSYVGRGNGKSAFSLELMRKINSSYLMDISEENNKCFCIHISPEPSGRTKSFYSLTDLIFEGILGQNFIEYCLAVLRLEGILHLNPNFEVSKHFNEDEDYLKKLNDREWFEENGIQISSLTDAIFKINDKLNRVSSEFPLRSDRKVFYNYRITTKETIRNYYNQTLKKGKERIDFIFNDLVYLFEASGFNGAFLIIDDFERIPDFQSDRSKRDFALELRTNFFDGISENAKVGFYNLLLVLHAGVPRLIEKAWSDTGMERRSPLSSDNYGARHIILFNKLNIEHAQFLLKKYLEEYRINPQEQDKLFPFTDGAVAVISQKAELNAASILEKAHGILEKAVEQGVNKIDESFVNEYFGQNEIHDEEDSKPTDDNSTDLFAKATNE